jgi:2-phospho-L-lactate guanylyltransferase
MQDQRMSAERAIVIPCKALACGKSRLSPVLAPDARARLCAQMLQRAIKTALALVPHSSVWLVTSDVEATSLAARLGVTIVPDPGAGLNAALETARRAVFDRDHRVESLLILPIDLPLLHAEALAGAFAGGADVAIAADRARSGTNLLHLSSIAARDLPFSYGEGSFHRHRYLALRSGYTLRVMADDALAFDLDEPRDWLELNAGRTEWRPGVGTQLGKLRTA